MGKSGEGDSWYAEEIGTGCRDRMQQFFCFRARGETGGTSPKNKGRDEDMKLANLASWKEWFVG